MKQKSTYLCKRVWLDLLIHLCLQFQSDRAEVRTHSSAAEGSGPIRQRSTPCKQTACHLDVLFTGLLLFFNATLERDIHWKKEYGCFTPTKRQSSPPVSCQVLRVILINASYPIKPLENWREVDHISQRLWFIISLIMIITPKLVSLVLDFCWYLT